MSDAMVSAAQGLGLSRVTMLHSQLLARGIEPGTVTLAEMKALCTTRRRAADEPYRLAVKAASAALGLAVKAGIERNGALSKFEQEPSPENAGIYSQCLDAALAASQALAARQAECRLALQSHDEADAGMKLLVSYLEAVACEADQAGSRTSSATSG